MGESRYLGALGAALLAVGSPVAAHAAGVSFDCDVPPDRYSSIAAELVAPLEVSGTVSPVELRSGRFLPMASLHVTRPDHPGVGFQIVAASSRAKTLDLYFNNDLTPDRRTPLGTVDADQPIAFRFTLGEDGKGTLRLGDETFTFAAGPLVGGTLRVSCSTGQFKFAELVWSGGS